MEKKIYVVADNEGFVQYIEATSEAEAYRIARS